MSITAEGNIVVLQSVSNDIKESYVEYQIKKCSFAESKAEKT
jgi:hypothetical protein